MYGLQLHTGQHMQLQALHAVRWHTVDGRTIEVLLYKCREEVEVRWLTAGGLPH